MAPRLTKRIRQASASANPGAVPALPEKRRQDRHHQKRSQKAIENERQWERKDIARRQVFHLQRPQIAEVILRLMEKLQQLRNGERERNLHENDHAGAHNLISVVPVLADHMNAAPYDGNRVEESVQRPLAIKTHGARRRSEPLGEVEHQVKRSQRHGQQPGDDTAVLDVMQKPLRRACLDHARTSLAPNAARRPASGTRPNSTSN